MRNGIRPRYRCGSDDFLGLLMRLIGLNTDLACRDFSQRSREREWLDHAKLDHDEIRNVLPDFARFNAGLLVNLPALRWHGKTVNIVSKNHAFSAFGGG